MDTICYVRIFRKIVALITSVTDNRQTTDDALQRNEWL